MRDFGLLHVSSGDLLRAQMREGTELGLAAKSYIGIYNVKSQAVIYLETLLLF